MAQIEVVINGRSYQMACDDGQETHLAELARYVDKRVKELIAAVGQVGDLRLLVMASLLIADELAEAYIALEQHGEQAANGNAAEELTKHLENVATRIENVAARLSAP